MPQLDRSELSVPTSNWRMIEKAVASGADVVLMDLEDSVAPRAKAESRGNVIRAIKELQWGEKSPAFRMNAVDTPYFYRDLIDVVEEAGSTIDMIVVPKVESPETLVVVDTLLTQIEASVGLERGKITLQAQIESAGGMINVDRIARATTRLSALNFGPYDYAASVRMPMAGTGMTDHWDEQYPGHRFHYPMSRVVIAAHAAGLRAIDGPVADFRNPDAFRRSAVVARGLGYDGKWCIHPGQIEMANEIFSPTEGEIAWAQKVVTAYREAHAEGVGAISVDNTMIDAATIQVAEAMLSVAKQIGRV